MKMRHCKIQYYYSILFLHFKIKNFISILKTNIIITTAFLSHAFVNNNNYNVYDYNWLKFNNYYRY